MKFVFPKCHLKSNKSFQAWVINEYIGLIQAFKTKTLTLYREELMYKPVDFQVF
jgi:hypothetical protein